MNELFSARTLLLLIRRWTWLAAAAGLVLLGEMFLVHRVCPRLNPGVAEPVVQRRGLPRPPAE
jgi:hypothetical protein